MNEVLRVPSCHLSITERRPQDRTILATAIPRITDDFDSLGDVAWYISSYLLTIGPFMLLFGRIYTFYDPKWVLISSIAIFEIGSAVCGAAPNSTALIVGRSVAGLGASGVTVGALTIVIFSVSSLSLKFEFVQLLICTIGLRYPSINALCFKCDLFSSQVNTQNSHLLCCRVCLEPCSESPPS